MKSLLTAAMLLLAVAVTALLTAGATVLALQVRPELGAVLLGGPDAPRAASPETAAAPTTEPTHVPPETVPAGRDDPVGRAIHDPAPSPAAQEDGHAPGRAGTAAPPSADPAPVTLLVAHDAPSTPPEPEGRAALATLSGGAPAAAQDPAVPRPDRRPFESVDYLKLSSDLQRVSQTLERFNRKLMQMIATTDTDGSARPSVPPGGDAP